MDEKEVPFASAPFFSCHTTFAVLLFPLILSCHFLYFVIIWLSIQEDDHAMILPSRHLYILAFHAKGHKGDGTKPTTPLTSHLIRLWPMVPYPSISWAEDSAQFVTLLLPAFGVLASGHTLGRSIISVGGMFDNYSRLFVKGGGVVLFVALDFWVD